MNLLLDDSDTIPYFTDVGAILRAIDVSASSFDWYVSDIETNFFFEDLPQHDGWISGAQLEGLLARSGLQFIWAVFSAFPRGTQFPVDRPPFAEGNGRFWREGAAELRPQLDGAIFELVCWDSSATLLIGVTPEQAQKFLATYPQAGPLAASQA